MKKTHQDYYINNSQYSTFLDTAQLSHFSMYIDEVIQLAKNKKKLKFLDVGCGTGIVVHNVTEKGIEGYGIEISKTSLMKAKSRKGSYMHYNGSNIPYDNGFFDIVGSFDVLEHVDNVNDFLREELRVLKKGGYLIIATPNFLSTTNSFHYRTRGHWRKVLNFLILIKKILKFSLFRTMSFEKFEPIVRKNFQPDDDAVNLTNPIDILNWGKLNKLQLLKYEPSVFPSTGLKKLLSSIPLLKYFFGGVFVVFHKL